MNVNKEAGVDCGALFWGEETQRKEKPRQGAARDLERCGDEGPRQAELYREQAEELRLAREGKRG